MSMILLASLHCYLTMLCCYVNLNSIHCTKPTIHQVPTVLATSKNVLFPGHDHLLTPSTDDPLLADARAIIKVSCYQYQWLSRGYDLEIGHF